jgi:sulfate permease, SulP family
VILRLRGRTDLGSTFIDVLQRYAVSLRGVDSKLVIVSANERIVEQLELTTDAIEPSDVYMGDERVGAALRQAYEDALAWIARSSATAD